MKTKIYSLLLVCATLPLFSQVGINTSTPTATLDVNGTLKVRDTPAATTVTGYQILAQDNTTNEVYKMDPQLLTSSPGVNTSVYAAKKTSNLAVLNVAFPGNFKAINFKAIDRTVGSAALFDDDESSYTIPSTGVYVVGYSFKYSTGLITTLLATGGIGIARTRLGTSALIDSRLFSGVNLLAASVSMADTSINSIYSFQKDDKINFGTIDPGLTIDILSSTTASFYIYKISN